MQPEAIKSLARETARGIKTEEDLHTFRQALTRVSIEAALNAEFDEHLGYARHE